MSVHNEVDEGAVSNSPEWATVPVLTPNGVRDEARVHLPSLGGLVRRWWSADAGVPISEWRAELRVSGISFRTLLSLEEAEALVEAGDEIRELQADARQGEWVAPEDSNWSDKAGGDGVHVSVMRALHDVHAVDRSDWMALTSVPTPEGSTHPVWIRRSDVRSVTVADMRPRDLPKDPEELHRLQHSGARVKRVGDTPQWATIVETSSGTWSIVESVEAVMRRLFEGDEGGVGESGVPRVDIERKGR